MSSHRRYAPPRAPWRAAWRASADPTCVGGGYRVPDVGTESGWRRLLNEDLADLSSDELVLERRRLVVAIATGGPELERLLWCTAPLPRPLTVGAWLRQRERLVVVALAAGLPRRDS